MVDLGLGSGLRLGCSANRLSVSAGCSTSTPPAEAGLFLLYAARRSSREYLAAPEYWAEDGAAGRFAWLGVGSGCVEGGWIRGVSGRGSRVGQGRVDEGRSGVEQVVGHG